MVFHGSSWYLIVFYGIFIVFDSISMVFYSILWYFHGISMVFYGIPGTQAEVKAESGIAKFLPDRIEFFRIGCAGAQAEAKAERGIAEFLPDRIEIFFGSDVTWTGGGRISPPLFSSLVLMVSPCIYMQIHVNACVHMHLHVNTSKCM